jgi:small membrane protein
MTLIQPLLIVSLFTVLLYGRRTQQRLSARLALIFVAFSAAILVLSPSLSTRVALALGVGRGVDLIIYISLVAICVLFLSVFSRLQAFKMQITTLVRAAAIGAAREPVPCDPSERSKR